jgi:hypothetical protein
VKIRCEDSQFRCDACLAQNRMTSALGPNYQQAVLRPVQAQATRFGDAAALYQTGAFPHGVAE